MYIHCQLFRMRRPLLATDMELGHWVTGSMGHLGHLSRPGHRVIILTRCDRDPSFSGFRKNAQNAKRTFVTTMQILLFGAGYKYSYLLTYLVEYSSTR